MWRRHPCLQGRDASRPAPPSVGARQPGVAVHSFHDFRSSESGPLQRRGRYWKLTGYPLTYSCTRMPLSSPVAWKFTGLLGCPIQRRPRGNVLDRILPVPLGGSVERTHLGIVNDCAESGAVQMKYPPMFWLAVVHEIPPMVTWLSCMELPPVQVTVRSPATGIV